MSQLASSTSSQMHFDAEETMTSGFHRGQLTSDERSTNKLVCTLEPAAQSGISQSGGSTEASLAELQGNVYQKST
jgi:hypothetical protein